MHANINDDLIFTDPKSRQIIYSLITKQRLFQKPKKSQYTKYHVWNEKSDYSK